MQIRLRDDARDALTKLAIDERRDTRRQAEYLIERELERKGLLAPEHEHAARTLDEATP